MTRDKDGTPSAEIVWRDAYIAVYGCPPTYPTTDYRAAYKVIESAMARVRSNARPQAATRVIIDRARWEAENNFNGHCYTITQDTFDALLDVAERAASAMSAGTAETLAAQGQRPASAVPKADALPLGGDPS